MSESIATIAERARALFRSDVTRPYAARVAALKSLEAAMVSNEEKLFDALKTDLGKPRVEAYSSEIGIVYRDIRLTLKHLKSWVRPERRPFPLAFQPARAHVRAEPLGTSLIIAPWNYPLQLAFSPLIGALAAGCTVVLKPSEVSTATSAAIAECIANAFSSSGLVTVVQGGAEVSTALLAERWDSIFFTGSTKVGQVVMEAAAKHLTPVVLELGGKSPCIVDESTDLATTARRVMWGKCYNTGQTCIAPDYVLVHKNVKQAFVDLLKQSVREFFGDDPAKSPDYGRIINARHFARLQALMPGGTVAFGGQVEEATRYIAPTVLTDPKLSHPLMQEEIFGPLLPVIEVPDIDSAIRFVREREKPLALYVFSKNRDVVEKVLGRVSSGGAVVNDTIIHFAGDDLPFGGVGGSGMGAYHGKASFDAFSHRKAVVTKPFWMDLKVRYPPYPASLALFRRLIG